MKLAAGRSRSVGCLNGLLAATSRSSQAGLEVLPQHGVVPFSPTFFDLELDLRAASSNNLVDKCLSEMQLQQLGEEDLAGAGPLLQQILMLCRCKSPMQAQLLGQLQRLRRGACAAGSVVHAPCHAAAKSPSQGSSLAAGMPAGKQQACGPAGSNGSSLLEPATQLDVQAMACELLAQGYLVQVRDGAAQQQQQQLERSKSQRSCLQNLHHSFMVCLGWRSSGDAEPCYLPEPLVLEPRLREQFAIAHPTPDYESLLQSVPTCFVGPVANLEAIVKLLCEQMTATFKRQGLPVPPWRTRSALLSKWCPAQLAELAAKIANLRRLSSGVAASAAIAPCQSHERLYNDDRPAAAHAAHAAVGSAPSAAVLVGQARGWPLLQPGALDVQSATLQQPAVHAAGQGLHGTTLRTAALGHADAGWHQPAHPSAGACSSGAPPATAAAVHTLLGPGDEYHGCTASGAPLKFSRNASAEWKHQRSASRNIKGLLAAALNKSSGGAGRTSTNGASPSLFVEEGPPTGWQAAAGPPECTTSSGSGSAGAGPAQRAPSAAAGPGADALIRRTHFRASGDEPWRRITTVRWGAFAAQQSPQQAAHPGPQAQPKVPNAS